LAGIYLHIPFCKQACAYCNFHFATSLRYKDEMIAALVKEIELQKPYLEGEEIRTIYFGGGTPSLLTPAECGTLLDAIRNAYPVTNDAEITLEANPDDITKEKLKAWKNTGINRLSIGIQSFFEADLQWMNRAHNSTQAITALEWALEEFNNITIDLIYGSPLLTDEMWQANVQKAIDYKIPHLSCYALTVEEKTPLHKQISSNKKENVEEEKQARQFLYLMKTLNENGYEHYEVSNFAKPGFYSRHNSSYWKGEKYLGIGPSAHSFNGASRQWNIANNNKYIQGINKGVLEAEVEVLTLEQQLNEYIMISLRTMQGMDLEKIRLKFGEGYKVNIEKKLQRYKNTSLLIETASFVQLTEEGMLRADGIAADLFM
jgi:oxygen-independent coproporphyrinogen III oxidase